MNKDFSELIEYLDKKFAETAKQKDLDILTERVNSLIRQLAEKIGLKLEY